MGKSIFDKLLGNQKGMSLPTVMMVAVGGVIVVGTVAGLLINSGKSTQRRTDATSFETFHENMRALVENPVGCTSMLQGTTLNVTIGGETLVTLDHDFDNSTPELSPNWQDQNNDFQVKDVVLKTLGGVVRTPREHDQPGLSFTYPVRMVIRPKLMRISVDRELDPSKPSEIGLISLSKMNFEHGSQNPLKKANLDTRLFVTVDSSAVIQKCFGYTSEASSCEASGGTFDIAESNPEMKCKPDYRCFASRAGLVDDPNKCAFPFNQTVTDMGELGGSTFDPATMTVPSLTDRKVLCQWCHPHPHPDVLGTSYVAPTGEVIGGADEWLEQKWRAIETKANDAFAAGIAPDDMTATVPNTSITLMDLATEWDYLLATTYESDVTLSDDAATQAIQDAVDALDDAKQATVAKQDEIQNLTWTEEDLVDEVAALEAKEASGKTNDEFVAEAQTRFDNANAALAASPADSALQQAVADAQEDLGEAIEVRDNNVTANDKKAELAQARADLSQAQTDLTALQTAEAENQAAVDVYTNGGELDVNELLDPTEMVKDWLVATYGFDPQVIEYMDQVRGCVGYTGAGTCN